MKLIDTDIAIDHFHGNRAALDYFAENIAAGQVLAISVVTLAELYGGMRPDERERTARLLELFVALDVTPIIAVKAGDYLNQFRRSHNLELGDALIAATALHHDIPVITRNTKHYPMGDIQVVVPYERGR